MTNITTYPLIDVFETTLAQERDGATGDVYLDAVPAFTFPSWVTTYIVCNPNKTNMQVGKIDSMNTTAKTVHVSSISVNKWASVAYTQQTHAQWSVVRITDSYQFWKDIVDSVNSKLDANGGNATTTFDLDLSGSLFRIRKDGSDMKFTDDNQSEVTLSQLAAWAGVDEKLKASATDTTAGYLDGKLTAWDGLSKTLVSGWSNESIDLDIDLSDTTIFTSTAVASKVPKTNGSWYLTAFINSNSDWAADTDEKWLAETATVAEVVARTDSTRYVTPEGIWAITQIAILQTTRASDTASWSVTVAHGLSQIPKWCMVVWHTVESDNITSSWFSNGSTNKCSYAWLQTSWLVTGNDWSNAIAFYVGNGSGQRTQTATITFDATNVTLTWTKASTSTDPNKTMNITLFVHC